MTDTSKEALARLVVHLQRGLPISRPDAEVFVGAVKGLAKERDDARKSVAFLGRELLNEDAERKALASENERLRKALRDVEPWAHVLAAPSGHGTAIIPDQGWVASMTPSATNIPSLKHAGICPGCAARQALGEPAGPA